MFYILYAIQKNQNIYMLYPRAQWKSPLFMHQVVQLHRELGLIQNGFDLVNTGFIRIHTQIKWTLKQQQRSYSVSD